MHTGGDIRGVFPVPPPPAPWMLWQSILEWSEFTTLCKDQHSPVIAALSTIAKTWNEPKCPLTDAWIKKMWYIYTMEYYSALKKNKIMPFAATWADPEIIILSEVSQKEKDKYIWYHLFMESKIRHKWTYLQDRNRLTDRENRLVVAKGEGGGGGKDWEFGISTCKLLYTGWINNKVLLHNTGNYIQYPVINHNGKQYEKEYIYIYLYNWVTLLYSRN